MSSRQNLRSLYHSYGWFYTINCLSILQKMQMSENNHIQSWSDQAGQQSSTIAKPVKLTTNLYEIRADKLMSAFFKYELLPSEQRDSKENLLVYRSLGEKRLLFEKRIDYVCDFQDGFLGSKRVDGDIELKEEDNTDVVLHIKLVESYTLEEILRQDCKLTVLRHLISPIVKKCVEISQAITKKDQIQNHRIVITPKFEYNFVEIKKKVYLATNVNVCIKEDCSLLAYFERYKDQESHKKLMIGKEVIANYGSRSRYTILNIDYSKTPQTIHQFDNKECSFIEFYKEKHIINIGNPNQHLLVARRCEKGTRPAEDIYLVPELVSFNNSVNPNEMSERMIQKIEQKKWQLPQQKEIYALRIIRQLGQNEIIKKSAYNFEGSVLRPPAIQISGRSIYPEDGIFNFRGRIFKPIEMTNWGLVYLEGKDKEANNNEIARLLFYMKSVCTQYGIKIENEPGMIKVQGDINQWKTIIQSDVQRYGLPQMLVFFLRDEEMQYCHVLNHYIVSELKCNSQIIRRRQVESETRKPFSIVSDILLKIQSKMGAILWDIGSNINLSSKKIMFGAINIGKDKSGYSVSFVGYMNAQAKQVFSFNKRGFPKLSDINFELLVIHWGKNYFMNNNKSLPDNIVIYRQAIDDICEQAQVNNQIQQVKTAIKKIGEKTKVTNYNPSISYIGVSESHKVEIYSRSENEQKELILENPEPGTVVIEKLSDESLYTFYLNANREVENTTKPVKFTIFEDSNISTDNLVGFTYEQCYSCYDFKGSLTVPALVHYAKKLSNFSEKTSVHVGYDDKMTKALYFI